MSGVIVRAAAAAEACPPPGRLARRALVAWLFCGCQAARVLAYGPTVWAIHSAGDASQHAVWTWLIFFAANLSMALSLYQRSGRFDRHVLVNIANATMCLAVLASVFVYRT